MWARLVPGLRKAGSPLVGLILPAVLLMMWWVLSRNSTSPYFPPLPKILAAFVDTWFFAHFHSDLAPSVLRLLGGLAIAIVLGAGAGLVIGNSARLRRDVMLVVEFFRAMPIAALVPLAFVFVGPGATMEIALIAFGSFWPVLIATMHGVMAVDPTMLETARVFRVSKTRRLFLIVLPAASPQIAAGIRIALAISIATMIVANLFGASNGLGNFVFLAQQSFDVLSTWAGLLMIGLIGLVLNGLYLLLQYRALAWHRGWRRLDQ